MSASTSTNDNELILAAALSTILGKEILSESITTKYKQSVFI
jgi:GTP-sensing pleiotropic transcriptional regulator CodY